MAMTAAVKDELSRVDVPKPCCRRSEMAALLRFSGGLHIVSGRVVVEAELDTGNVARRLRREIAEELTTQLRDIRLSAHASHRDLGRE